VHVLSGALVYLAVLILVAPQFGRDLRDALRLVLARRS